LKKKIGQKLLEKQGFKALGQAISGKFSSFFFSRAWPNGEDGSIPLENRR
tara:strand:- start:432 stop:581 length:150 start_codon:yes stop_codon:yes gene_type:complete